VVSGVITSEVSAISGEMIWRTGGKFGSKKNISEDKVALTHPRPLSWKERGVWISVVLHKLMFRFAIAKIFPIYGASDFFCLSKTYDSQLL